VRLRAECLDARRGGWLLYRWYYEDLSANKTSFDELARFLLAGAKCASAEDFGFQHSTTYRIHSDLSAAVSNWDEVRKKLARTRYREFVK